MGLSAPWDDSLDNIALNPVLKYYGLTQWALVNLGTNILWLLPFRQLKRILRINPMVRSAP